MKLSLVKLSLARLLANRWVYITDQFNVAGEKLVGTDKWNDLILDEISR